MTRTKLRIAFVSQQYERCYQEMPMNWIMNLAMILCPTMAFYPKDFQQRASILLTTRRSHQTLVFTSKYIGKAKIVLLFEDTTTSRVYQQMRSIKPEAHLFRLVPFMPRSIISAISHSHRDCRLSRRRRYRSRRRTRRDSKQRTSRCRRRSSPLQFPRTDRKLSAHRHPLGVMAQK